MHKLGRVLGLYEPNKSRGIATSRKSVTLSLITFIWQI